MAAVVAVVAMAVALAAKVRVVAAAVAVAVAALVATGDPLDVNRPALPKKGLARALLH